ncbi:MAG: DUF899 family protein [Mycobacteriales bacterium]
MPWYSAAESIDVLMAGRGPFMLACYLRQSDRVFETYWTTGRGVEVMDQTYGLLDRSAYGRQEAWEHSPAGWPKPNTVDDHLHRVDGRPTAQWSSLAAGRSDDLRLPDPRS